MKKFFKSLALATVLVLSFSCSKESPVGPGNDPSQPEEPKKFSVQDQKAYIADVTKQFTENFNEPKIYDVINVMQYAYYHYLADENYNKDDILDKVLASVGLSGILSHKSKGTKRNVKETADSTIIENCNQYMETFPLTSLKGTFTAGNKKWSSVGFNTKNLIFNFSDSTGTKYTVTINANNTITNAYICKYNRTRTLKNENIIDNKLVREYDVEETLIYMGIPSQIDLTLKMGNIELLSANINSNIKDINSYFDNPYKCSISSEADVKVNNMGFKLKIDFKNGYTKTYVEGYINNKEKYIDAEIEGNYMLVGDVILNIDLEEIIKNYNDFDISDIEIENNMTLNDSIKDLKYCIGIMDSIEIRGMIKDPYMFVSDFENGIKTTDSTETLNYVEKFNSNMSNSLGYRNINYTPNNIYLKEVKQGDGFTINPFIVFNENETISAVEFFDSETFAHVIEYALKYKELLPDFIVEQISK